ncbi:hypothetical protein HEP74_00949 [Xanthomonas sp. SS]|nr:hypothetical protein HEP74_00949 [Xanthomonas sp. SS]
MAVGDALEMNWLASCSRSVDVVGTTNPGRSRHAHHPHRRPHPCTARGAAHRALIDSDAVATWTVPGGVTSEVHVFEAREQGRCRISLTYTVKDAHGTVLLGDKSIEAGA